MFMERYAEAQDLPLSYYFQDIQTVSVGQEAIWSSAGSE
mgnify:CR=1 FL=1